GQHDVVDDHPGLAAAVDRLLQDLEEVLDQQHLHAVVLARVEVAVELQDQPVGLVLQRAQLVVHALHRLELHVLELAHHLVHHAGGLLQHAGGGRRRRRSEEHTSELQSRENLVCRLLLEKKKKKKEKDDKY